MCDGIQKSNDQRETYLITYNVYKQSGEDTLSTYNVYKQSEEDT